MVVEYFERLPRFLQRLNVVERIARSQPKTPSHIAEVVGTEEDVPRGIVYKIRILFGYVSERPVMIGGYYLNMNGYTITYHNLYHFEVSKLDRIRIGDAFVSGVHGFYSPMFHSAPIEIEYNGAYDEARVAVHEWLTRPSVYNTLKLLNWSVWLMSAQINPIVVYYRHWKSLQRFSNSVNQYTIESLFPLHYFQAREFQAQNHPAASSEVKTQPSKFDRSSRSAAQPPLPPSTD